MGNWIFGCDICQQVCPWNKRFASSDRDTIFARRPEVPQPDLIAELSLSPQEFNLKFKGSPVKRTKRRGYLRNITVALGNLKPIAAVPPLTQTLMHEHEPMVRGHAAWALGQIGGEITQQALSEAGRSEEDPYVLGEIYTAQEG